MLDLEANESLSQRGPDKPQSVHISSNEVPQDMTNANISFKVSQAIKGPMVKRAKDPLEKKGTKKKTGTKKPKSGTKKGAGNKVTADSLVREGPQEFTGTSEASTRTNTTVPHLSNNMFHGEGHLQFTSSFEASGSSNITMPYFSNNMIYGQGPSQFKRSFEAGASSNTTMPDFPNNMFHGQGPPQFLGSFEAGTRTNTAIPHFSNNTYHGDSSTMFGPFVQGGYTELLLQNDRASEMPHPSRRLDFDLLNPGGSKK